MSYKRLKTLYRICGIRKKGLSKALIGWCFVLSNDDISSLASRLESAVDETIQFDPSRDIITTKEILQKSQFDPRFLAELHEFMTVKAQ